MQEANGMNTEYCLSPTNNPAPEPANQALATEIDKLTITELATTAEKFNAAFNTALYELETNRRLLKERSARIEELNDSITTLNAALQKQVDEARSKDTAHAAEAQALNQRTLELESERDTLQQQIAKLRHGLEVQAGELTVLNARVTELTTTLEQQRSESLQATEAHTREKLALDNAHAALQDEYDVVRTLLSRSEEDLETRTDELADFAGQVESLSTELAALSEAGKRQEAVHRQESERLRAEIESLNGELRTREEKLQQNDHELKSRANEVATLKERISELDEALQSQTSLRQEEAESHVRTCEELNARIGELDESLRSQVALREQEAESHAGTRKELNEEISRLSDEYDSLKVIHDELQAHVAKLENLNRALHDSSTSENDVHRKIITEKDAAIAALKARLAAAQPSLHGDGTSNDADDASAMAHIELETRLQESEAKAQMFAERAGIADELEVQIQLLKQELQVLQHGEQPAAESEGVSTPLGHSTPTQLLTEREQFITRLDDLITANADGGAKHSLMYILLDNFMRVRDEIGILHSAEVIDETSAIIEACCTENDVVTRFGDCTFAVLCMGTSADEVQTKAGRIRSNVEHHIFEVDGRSLVISTSIGICAVRDGDTGADQVISRADLACESARLSGGNQVVMSSAVSEELRMPDSNARVGNIVDKILVENRIKIYYQPISNLKQNTIDCFEVLTRVIDENNDIILPGEFFTMAVNSGKALEVDHHIIDNVLKLLAEKPDPGMKYFIKLTRQTVSSHEFPEWLSNKLEEYRINPGQLVFEVSEQVMESDLKSLSRLSRELNTLGCRIAIEHYRLDTQPQHLRHIHPEYLKIDSELVQNISKKGKGLAKVNEIMDLAKMNNLTTIAEGVETPGCLAILWELGVGFAQGYLISEPSGHAKFETFDVDNENDKQHDSKAVFTIS